MRLHRITHILEHIAHIPPVEAQNEAVSIESRHIWSYVSAENFFLAVFEKFFLEAVLPRAGPPRRVKNAFMRSKFFFSEFFSGREKKFFLFRGRIFPWDDVSSSL